MDAFEPLRTIRTLARIALEGDIQGASVETIAEIQRRSLNGIVVVTEKALAEAP